MKNDIVMMVMGAVPIREFTIAQSKENLDAVEKLKTILIEEGYVWYKDFYVTNDGANITIEVNKKEIEAKVEEILVQEKL
jgi:hypothetical protein